MGPVDLSMAGSLRVMARESKQPRTSRRKRAPERNMQRRQADAGGCGPPRRVIKQAA